MSFATFNIQKVKTIAELYARCHHNYRESTPKNAHGEQSNLNRYNKNRNPAGRMVKRFNEAQDMRVAAGARKMRNTTVRAVEVILGASPEFFEGKSDADILEWSQTQVEWARKYYKGKGNVLGIALHQDEKTPHVHLLIEPLTHKVDKTTGINLPIWDAKGLHGNKSEMNKTRTSHARANALKYQLKRGKNYHELGETPPEYTKDIKTLRREQKELDEAMSNTSLEDLMGWANEVKRLIVDLEEADKFQVAIDKAERKQDKLEILKQTNKQSPGLKPTPPWMKGPGR